MIKAVGLVLAIALVVIAIVIIVNYYNNRDVLKRDTRMDYDEDTGVFYDGNKIDRVDTDGVISYRSKDDKSGPSSPVGGKTVGGGSTKSSNRNSKTRKKA